MQGQYYNISDGCMWRTIKGLDGCPFFDAHDMQMPRQELHISVTMSFDQWVHLSTAPRFNDDDFFDLGSVGRTANMDQATRLVAWRFVLLIYHPPYVYTFHFFFTVLLGNCSRYRIENLLISLMTPGPNEPTQEQMQSYLKIIVDDLINLYTNIVVICTPSDPNGTFCSFWSLFL